MTGEDPAPPTGALLDEDSRRLAAAAIAGATLGWWPAFTLGVYESGACVLFLEWDTAPTPTNFAEPEVPHQQRRSTR